MKECDLDAARANAAAPLFDPGHGNMIDINTTTKTPSEVADLVVQAVRAFCR